MTPCLESLSPRSELVNVVRYRSLIELRKELERLERNATADPRRQETAVLVLDEAFAGHLSALIRRRRPGYRLVLVPLSGRLPGSLTIGDLCAAGGALGWRQIVLERDLDDAVEGVVQSLVPHETLIVFSPAWRDIGATN